MPFTVSDALRFESEINVGRPSTLVEHQQRTVAGKAILTLLSSSDQEDMEECTLRRSYRVSVFADGQLKCSALVAQETLSEDG